MGLCLEPKQSAMPPLYSTVFTTETSKTNGVSFTAQCSKYHRFEVATAIVPEGK
jgi:hypothetical protein